MLQHQQQIAYPKKLSRPKRFDVFFHLIKTGKLIGLLLGDRRISIVRKGSFLLSIGALLIVLLFPDVLGEVVWSTILPFVGTILGIPIDAGFDWAAFAVVVVSLLRFFPAEVVSEHYLKIFKS